MFEHADLPRSTSDIDAQSGSLTLHLNTDVGGELFGTSVGGITVVGTPDYVPMTGTPRHLNAYLTNASNIQYLPPTPNLNGNDADFIYVFLNDNGNTGSGGGFNVYLGWVNVDITAVNDTPVITIASLTLNEGQTVTLAPTGSRSARWRTEPRHWRSAVRP